MGRQKKTNTEKLLNAVRKNGGMTRKEMVSFLLKRRGFDYNTLSDNYTYNALLYGTSRREGILERFCRKDKKTDKWVLAKGVRVQEPFTPVRTDL